jgi:pyruvate,water dikinase
MDSLKIFVSSERLLIAYSSDEVIRAKLIIVNTKEDVRKVEDIKEPFILGSHSTSPDLLPAMVKSAGIITEIGGMTSHAAVVSRELKKPCIVGFKSLFKKFKEGDIVELDTKKGEVRRAGK